MQEQNLKNHGQFVLGFHIVTTLLILGAIITAVMLIVSSGFSTTTLFCLFVAVTLLLLFWYTRSFATGNQDRVIRAEENFRVYRLTGKMMDSRLTRSQIIALRFADDSEYAELSERAIKENLTNKQIKEAIAQWKADHHRI